FHRPPSGLAVLAAYDPFGGLWSGVTRCPPGACCSAHHQSDGGGVAHAQLAAYRQHVIRLTNLAALPGPKALLLGAARAAVPVSRHPVCGVGERSTAPALRPVCATACAVGFRHSHIV